MTNPRLASSGTKTDTSSWKGRIHNRLQEKKNETCFEEQVTTFQNEE